MYKTKESHRLWTKNRDVKHKETVKRLIAEFRSKGCSKCSESDPCCLDAHHVDPSKKDFNISCLSRIRYCEKRIKEELAKCICVCKNCHAKIHKTLKVIPNGGYFRKKSLG